MQTLDVQNPGLPDLQFVLMVVALCTSGLPTLNLPQEVRETVFDRCWALLHDTPPPTEKEKRDGRMAIPFYLFSPVKLFNYLRRPPPVRSST